MARRFGLEAKGGSVMLDDHSIALGLPGDALVVQDSSPWRHANRPACFVAAPAQIHVFSEHKERFIEAAENFEYISTHSEASARNPIDSPIATRTRRSIAARKAILWRDHPKQGMACGIAQGGEPAN
jgi:hypothetical protein